MFRKIVFLDITSDEGMTKDDEDLDVRNYRSECTQHSFEPLGSEYSQWKNRQPMMCAYKLVRVRLEKFGLQSIAEAKIMGTYPRILKRFHRQVRKERNVISLLQLKLYIITDVVLV